MVKNEVGTEIPEHILNKAMDMGCLSSKYIYQDGKYIDNKCPASNLGGNVSRRFQNMDNANTHKIIIEDKWVIFESPSHSAKNKELRGIKTQSQVK
ncbi:MAG: hypothetical protein ACFFG0_35915, partial [Candidatus Thorarchaeota archaeon]